MSNYNNVLFIPRGDNFDRMSTAYYSHYEELHKAFHTPKFTVGDTEVAYRVINHWDQNGLLPDGFKKGDGWRVFSLVEMAWLRIIMQLRQFGMSLEQIRKAKDGITAWDRQKKSYPMLEYYLGMAVASDLNVYAVVAEDGRGGLATDDEIVACRAIDDNMPGMLMISLKAIVKGLGFTVQSPSNDAEPDLVTDLPDRVKEVKIERNKSGVKEIETTEVHPADSIKEIQKQLHDSGAFGEMTIKYKNGKEQSAEVKVRKRIKR